MSKSLSASVPCPTCNHAFSEVIDSRCINGIRRRRRKCVKCNERYSTVEVYINSKEQDFAERRARLTLDHIRQNFREVFSLLGEEPKVGPSKVRGT